MKIVKEIGKVLLSGLLSIAILSGLMCGYSLLPVHIENEKGNTDYVWPANSVWVKMTEGISWGKLDANGLNNKSVIENPDILILGSSHMEAINVMQDQNTAYLLNEKLNGRYSVYNFGVSDHDIYKVCQYVPANLELYGPSLKAIIIETDIVELDEKNVQKVLDGTVAHSPSYSSGLIGTLQRIPFFRVLYSQTVHGLLKLFMPSSSGAGSVNNDTAAGDDTKAEKPVEEQAYSKLFHYLSQQEKKYGTQIIVFYHPTGTLEPDGTIKFNSDEHLAAFHKYAEAEHIDFVDLTSDFEDMFYNEHHVAHGFTTGQVEFGHINSFGHAKAAEALSEKIEQLEEAGEICQ